MVLINFFLLWVFKALKMVKIRLSICLIIGLFLISCTRKQDMLTIQRQDYTGNELRLDGFYTSIDEFNGEKHYAVYFLYENGVVFYTTVYSDDKEKMKEKLELFDSSNHITSWGVFVVNNNTITIEKWWPGNGYNAPVVKTNGTIKNDTSFTLNRSSFIDYFFTPFSPKPDSTNTFIE